MRETKSTDGDKMAKYMESKTFELKTGTLKWSDAASGHEPDKSAVVVELVNGKPIFKGWVSPAFIPAP
jgi:branched-chain amino acid transport system substrate-binding protein